MNNYIKKKRLLITINKKRNEMIDLGQRLGLTNEQTVACSQQLDQLLNKYDNIHNTNLKVFPRREKMVTFLHHIALQVLERKMTIHHKTSTENSRMIQ